MVPTSKQKAAEITMRAIVMVLQLVTITSGAAAVGLTITFWGSNVAIIAAEAIAPTFAMIMLVYEIFMIIFTLKRGVNHPARLLGDVVFNSVLAALTGLATMFIGPVLATLSSLVHFLPFFNLVIAVALWPIVIVGALHTAAFVVSAMSSSTIHKRLTKCNVSNTRATATNPMSLTAVQVVGSAPPTTFVMVSQPEAGLGAGASPGCTSTVPADSMLPASGQEGNACPQTAEVEYGTGTPPRDI